MPDEFVGMLMTVILSGESALGGAWIGVKKSLAAHRAQMALDHRAEWTARIFSELVEGARECSAAVSGSIDDARNWRFLTEGFGELLPEAYLYASPQALNVLDQVRNAVIDLSEDPDLYDKKFLREFGKVQREAPRVLAADFRELLGQDPLPDDVGVLDPLKIKRRKLERMFRAKEDVEEA